MDGLKIVKMKFIDLQIMCAMEPMNRELLDESNRNANTEAI